MPIYPVDDLDHVARLTDLPQCDPGAPLPVVMASDNELVVGYLLRDVPPDWNGTSVRVVSTDTSGEPYAVVRFGGKHAHLFGGPNDEAFSGHPLASRGLLPYGSFEVLSSSWIRALERMNRVHPYHHASMFDGLRHFVLSFHDTSFECVAEGYSVKLGVGSVKDMMQVMVTMLARD